MIGTTLSHYRIVEQIGAGGMGVVYRAHDERLDRDVAIKVLPESVAADPGRLARFENEARAVAKLAHPNILEIWDFGTEGGVTYAVTELLEGENLRQRIPSGGMGWQKVTKIGASLADGLSAAQSKGIVHRDLKPENIFITSDGRVKILDFGLAQMKEPVREEAETATLTPAGTVPGTVMGTVGYMSPEQVRGHPADARSDIFALGCVLYEMLAGRIAFARETTADTQAAILKEEPPPLTSTGVTLPAELERSITRCLEKSPEARFQSASDLAYNLCSITTDHAVPMATPTAVAVPKGRPTVLVTLAAAAALIAAATAMWFLRPDSVDAPGAKVLPRIAVLPFENLGQAEDEYFADGMTEALITELGKISALRVIGRLSVMRFKGSDRPPAEIAREFNVDRLIIGSSTPTGSRVRITIQLIDPANEGVLWSQDYERDLSDILALQGEVARAISREIRVQITPDEERRLRKKKRVAPEAQRAYNEGQRLRFRFQDAEALQYFERAVEIDSNFAESHAAMADVLRLFGVWGTLETQVGSKSRALEAIDAALEIDPDLSDAHAVLGMIKWQYEWDWPGAETALRRAVELNPSSVIAQSYLCIFLNNSRRAEEAEEGVEHCEIAGGLDPTSMRTNFLLAGAYYVARRYDEITALVEIHREFNRSLWDSWTGVVYATQGLYEQGARLCDQTGLFGTGAGTAYCGQIWGLAGRREKALEALQILTSNPDTNPIWVAGIHAGLGDLDQAFAWVEKAYVQRRAFIAGWLRVPLVHDALATDPRYHDLLRRMNFPGY